MTTRSGANFRAMDQEGSHAEGTPAEDQMITGSNTLPELANLTDMVRVMLEDRERRECEITEERERRDREFTEERERMDRQRENDYRHYAEEGERRIAEMHRQMECLQQLVTERSAS